MYRKIFLIVFCLFMVGDFAGAGGSYAKETAKIEIQLDEDNSGHEWPQLKKGKPYILRCGQFKLHGGNIVVKKATLNLYYRYEPAWTNVEAELDLRVQSMFGGGEKTVYSTKWFGCGHKNMTPRGRYHQFSIPPEIVQGWVDNNARQIDFKLYIAKLVNDKEFHSLIFGGVSQKDPNRLPKLKIEYEFTGNVPPSPLRFSTQLGEHVSGKVMIPFDAMEPPDLNTNDKSIYQTQINKNNEGWVLVDEGPIEVIGKTEIDFSKEPVGASFRLRIRSMDNHGASSDWSTYENTLTVTPESIEFNILPPVVKVRKFSGIGGSSKYVDFKYFGARGESEAVQLCVHTTTSLNNVSLTVDPFISRDGKSKIKDRSITIYRQRYMDIVKPSGKVGRTGWWPDALVPAVDKHYNEKRNVMPAFIAAGTYESFWIEIDVPLDQRAGIYTSTIRFTSDKTGMKKIPITFSVRNFTLPVQSSVKTAFGFDPSNMTVKSKGFWNDCVRESIAHRISFYTGYYYFGGSKDKRTGEWKINAHGFDRFFREAFSGEGMPLGRKFDSMNPIIKKIKPRESKIELYRALEKYLGERGLLEKSYFYVWDEPKAKHLAKVKERIAEMKEGAPRIKRMITKHPIPELRGLIDIWCPIVDLYENDKIPSGVELYEARRKLGEEVWIYTGYTSNNRPDLPNFFIDVQPIYARVLPWIMWRYDITGLLYYHMALTWNNVPWKNQWAFYSNGDGTLWYPGYTSIIGGTHPIPIPSIRLKTIRDGLEDYEYLKLLAKVSKDRATADSFCRSIAPGTRSWKKDPMLMLEQRDKIATAIEEHM